MSRPISTYRVQLTPDFGFAQLADIAGYLRDLGVSHVYLSPILQSTPASSHGYDVVDHSRIREEFGGAKGFRELAQRLAAEDLGIVLDLVPNHMNTDNPHFQRVLEEGPGSPYAKWFDLDWRDGKLAVPGVNVDFREGPGYRRFFDVSSLIGLRAEDQEVFAATHEVIFWLLDEGLVDGLRVDHPDGLADPRGYLRKLRARSGAVWTVVEKILIGEERLPEEWACDGTTGYEVLNRVNGLFVDPSGKAPLIDLFTRMTGQSGDYPRVELDAKREVIDLFFGAEVRRLGGGAYKELLAAMPVYRAYVNPGEPPPPESVDIVTAAAARCSPAVQPLVHEVLYGEAETITRFQQTTGPVMAKGVEDTALYRWFPLACLNEVGGEPDRFGVTMKEFHDYCGGMRPHTMTTLSTHDTKRSEDVRARLSVLAEVPGLWAAAVSRWSSAVRFDPLLDYLGWQNLMAAWPISLERFTDYLLKAAREAKTRISWINPDAAYEDGIREFARQAVDVPVGEFTALVDGFAPVNSLGAKLVQLMMPGVPDVYQGNEVTDFSLVDPDNRRQPVYPRIPVTSWDVAKLRVTTQALRLRRRLDPASPYEPLYAEGEAAEHAIAFARPGRRVRAVAVATRLPVGLARRAAAPDGWPDPRDIRQGWGSTTLTLPRGAWRDLLTGGLYTGRIPLAHLLSQHPVALLESHDL